MQEGDLGPLGRVGIAGREAAAVARLARTAGEGPAGARGTILEAMTQIGGLEPSVGDRRGDRRQVQFIDEGGVVAPALSTPWKAMEWMPAVRLNVEVL